MKIQCAWCKKDLGEKEPLTDNSISHGMCSDCWDEMFPGVSFPGEDTTVKMSYEVK